MDGVGERKGKKVKSRGRYLRSRSPTKFSLCCLLLPIHMTSLSSLLISVPPHATAWLEPDAPRRMSVSSSRAARCALPARPPRVSPWFRVGAVTVSRTRTQPKQIASPAASLSKLQTSYTGEREHTRASVEGEKGRETIGESGRKKEKAFGRRR